MFLNWLEAASDRVGWFSWYALTAADTMASPVLVASGGFKGPPQDKTVEVGYSVLPQFQGRGFATEMVCGLMRWALKQPGVARVVAETEWTNPGSVRVLSKAGFAPLGPTAKPGGAQFEFRGGVSTTDAGAVPNGDPATPTGNSGVTEGSPSVS